MSTFFKRKPKVLADRVTYATSSVILDEGTNLRECLLDNGNRYQIYTNKSGKKYYLCDYADLIGETLVMDIEGMRDVDRHVFLYLDRLLGDVILHKDDKRIVYNLNLRSV